MKRNLQEVILETLYAYWKSHRGSPEMLFPDLCFQLEAKNVSSQEEDLSIELDILEEKGWIEPNLTTSGQAGTIKLTSDGLKTAKGLKQPINKIRKRETVSKKKKVMPKPDYTQLFQRDDIANELKTYFIQKPTPKPNYIILHGQPMVGKTNILKQLARILNQDYVPLIVTGHVGKNYVSNIDIFAWDLAVQLTSQFNQWAKTYRRTPFVKPVFNTFNEGNGTRAFYAHWERLLHLAESSKPVVMYDEIEYLLDVPPHEIDNKIFTFLQGFVRNPDHGYFVIAGSEQIQHSKHPGFSELIGRGESFPVPYFDDTIVNQIFTLVRNYIEFEDNALQYLSSLCDGHPRILQSVVDCIVSILEKSQVHQRRLEMRDIEHIIEHVLKRIDDFLWAICRRLSVEEYAVIWLTSRNVPYRQEYSFEDLIELANSHLTQTQYTDDLEKGVYALWNRGWVEWKDKENRLFRLKLGIVPLWMRNYGISFEEMR